MKDKSSILINRNPLSGSLSDTECCFRIRVLSDASSPTSPHYGLWIMDYGVECGMSSMDVCSKITSCTQYHSIHYITSCTLFKCPLHCTAHGYCAGHNKVFSNHKTFMVYLGFRLPKWAVIPVKSCTSLLCFALV